MQVVGACRSRHTATHCNTLQHTLNASRTRAGSGSAQIATHCNTLQHTTERVTDTCRWWERTDRGFTEENLRNNLVLKVSQHTETTWVHTKMGVSLDEVGQVSPSLDRLEKKRNYQVVGCAQVRIQRRLYMKRDVFI